MTSFPTDDPTWLPRAEHVWVDGEPGILLGWSRRDGWQGWVVTASVAEVRQRWVAAACIEQA